MRADESVVTDTSPLLNLALIDRLDLLEAQFDSITVPESVWDELFEGDDIRNLQSLREQGFLTIVDVDRTDLYVEIGHELDVGETASITFAIEQDVDLLLLDEREGRRVARRHDIPVTGVIGVLLRGAREGQLDLRAELDALRDAGFWISDDLYAQAIRRAPEE